MISTWNLVRLFWAEEIDFEVYSEKFYSLDFPNTILDIKCTSLWSLLGYYFLNSVILFLINVLIPWYLYQRSHDILLMYDRRKELNVQLGMNLNLGN
jgi:hypothetical protein